MKTTITSTTKASHLPSLEKTVTVLLKAFKISLLFHFYIFGGVIIFYTLQSKQHTVVL